MPVINILPPEIFNRIAAGEVVERPASVVKELLENSIDAGASQIRIRVEHAGTKLISVTDNGCGMDADDAMLSLKPHGTSKIKQVEDIDRIATLGFRGEAIPSIASVSNFQLRTRKADSPLGFEVTLAGGEIQHSGPAGCAPGTEILVRDLFFNTPARRKFLRSFPTEESYIEEVIIAAALSNLNVAFEYIADGKRVLFSGADAGLNTRLHDFFGKKFAENMLPVKAELGNIRVSGVTAMPGVSRSSRRDQRSFVNGRPVESQAIFRGIRDGYGTLNERGRYSPCILFLHLPYSDFDINVHPAKRDVRFRQEYNVSRAVTAAIGIALKNTPVPESTLDAAISLDAVLQGAEISYAPPTHVQDVLSLYKDDTYEPTPPTAPQVHFLTDPEVMPDTPPPKPSSPPNAVYNDPDAVDIADLIVPAGAKVGISAEPSPEQPFNHESVSTAEYDNSATADPLPEPPEITANDMESIGKFTKFRKLIGVLDHTYLLFFNAGCNALEIMDQHAAHERVLFEQLLKQADSQVAVQPLLLPQMLELARPAAGWLSKNEALLGKLGFELAGLSSNSLILNAVPALLPEAEWENVLTDIYQAGRECAPGDSRPLLERTAAAACHAAVKAHDELSDAEVAALLRQLDTCERPDICPHGRPTTIQITVKELEKRFGRR